MNTKVDNLLVDNKGQLAPKLTRSVVCMADILGFKNLLLDATSDEEQERVLQHIYPTLQKAKRALAANDPYWFIGEKRFTSDYQWQLRSFTDDVLLYAPMEADGEDLLISTLQKISTFQLSLTSSGYFVRGAICIGDAYVDEVVALGMPIVDAYIAESTTANNPRILITNDVAVLLRKHMHKHYPKRGGAWLTPQNPWILIDDDDRWFVNYLFLSYYEVQDLPEIEAEYLEAHRNAIEVKLKTFSTAPVIYEKYLWVADYHNWFCEQYRQCYDGDYRIELGRRRPAFRTVIGAESVEHCPSWLSSALDVG